MSKIIKPSASDNLLALAKKHCSPKEIRAVLKGAKELNKDVESKGKNKIELLDHLRDAVALNAISTEELYKVVSESTESGSQLVRLYLPATESVRKRCNDGVGIATTLFGANWQENFPVPHENLTGEAWGDFRIDEMGSRGTNWTAKLEAGVERRTDRKEKIVGKQVITTQQLVSKQEAYLVKWHHYGLLEIRTPVGAKQHILESLNRVEAVLTPALQLGNEFNALDLRPALAKIRKLVMPPHKSQLFSWINLQLSGPLRGIVQLKALTIEDDVLSDEEVQRFVETCGSDNLAAIRWNFDRVDELHGVKKPLITFIGMCGENSFHIRTKAPAKAVRYVVDRLRQLV